ncbi:peptide chain release factor N(5)-glutamine methyltransferase [Candidatus Spongiihabitans sp.]|uniref:peptide chain release factor N(5)-glutamine methyltransferase n=1 Tax=Candidatus Spongiihabitans sp. TaxID=3101308 RepID=UPI003C798121
MESRILLGYVLGKDAAELIAHDDHTLSAAQIDAYHKIAGQRQQGVPVAYLTGIREFWSLPIKVNDRVLIPRHETETLVERVLALIDGGPKSDPKSGLGTRILELGTGSGAIALALASELPASSIVATDHSARALAVARGNQAALGPTSGLNNIEFLQSDWFANLRREKYHLICSNPPYLSADDEHLQIGDVRFEPRAALVADEQGYAAINHIARHAKAYLRSGGWLVLEHGFQQGQGVRQRLSDEGYGDITTAQDLSGNDRVTAARLPRDQMYGH